MLSDSDVSTLIAHCRAKTGVEEKRVWKDGLEFGLLPESLSWFAAVFLKEELPRIQLRCENARRESLEARDASVRISPEMRWFGVNWKWTDVALDGSVSVQEFLSLIDASFEYAQEKFSDSQKLMMNLLRAKLPPMQLLSELIVAFALQPQSGQIQELLLPALRLKTVAGDEAGLPLGSSKIGGHPDLPQSLAWPLYESRPLTFLAQINLDQVPREMRLAELPARGMLYLFSVYGWQADNTSDPNTPGDEPQPGWTQILYHHDDVGLRRCATPDGTSEYPAAGVTFHSTLCLPMSIDEPKVAALGWDEETAARFDELNSTFAYLANHADGPDSRHLLLGYADWVQYVIGPVQDENLRLLFQLASDENTSMCFGDGGYIYSFVTAADLREHRFSNIVTEYQSG